MKIRARILIYLFISLIIGTIVATFAVSMISISYIHQEEEIDITKNIKNANSILSSRMAMIEAILVDWTNWDDSYQFMNGEYESYIDINLGSGTLENYNLSSMVFLTKNYTVKHVDYSSESQLDLITPLINNEALMKAYLTDVDNVDLHTGITVVDGDLYLISASGITDSTGNEPANGYLILVQQLGNEFLSNIEELLEIDMDYFYSTDVITDNSISELQYESSIRENRQLITTTYLEDVLTGETIYFIATNTRISYINAIQTLLMVSLSITLIFIIIIFASYYSLNRIVISRILKLAKFLDKVISENNLTLRINPTGNDEITFLTRGLNRMLEMLNQDFDKLIENDERLHLLLDATSDGYLDYFRKTGTVIVSNNFLVHMGYHFESNQLTYDQACSFINKADMVDFRAKIDTYLKDNSSGFNAEVRVKKADGQFAWILVRGKTVEFDAADIPSRWIASLLDITEDKKKSEEIIYLLQTDPVTQLQNRNYLEGILVDLEQSSKEYYCIIMIDVNALKLTNDAFGHKEGDQLLRIVGDTLKHHCSDTDYPVRWGGDEFLILVRNNANYARELIKGIKADLDRYVDFLINVSVSIGLACYRETDKSIDNVIKRAEDRMYHEKISESSRIKEEILEELSVRLKKKIPSDFEKFPYLLKNLNLLGTAAGLSQHQLKKLSLLATYYNIGKITLPDELINKTTDTITDEDWKVFRTHPEAGYRIARQLPKLSSIADEILCIHEHIDGSGYPNNLEGDEIPLLSRILLIVLMYCTEMNVFNMDSRKVAANFQKYAGKELDGRLVELFLSLKK
ncbi:diguanylate cyclase [Eubacteriaceae bacterium ES3]|nr:diguanylate cyclase [Eubacteriaceae bacterium ES3]